MSNTLFISVDTIKLRTGLTANVEERLVLPEIYTCQDMFILPALGTALYERLQTGIVDGDLSEIEEALLDTYITPALVFFVMSEMPMGLSYQFYNKGVIKKTDENQVEPSASEMAEVANRYRSRAEFYKERLVNYLKEEAAADTFPEYNDPGSRCDTIKPEGTGYSSTIYMGE
jgi:hypothetical protein